MLIDRDSPCPLAFEDSVMFRRTLSICLGLALLAAGAMVSLACPFCSAPSLTLCEQLNMSDAAVLVQWESGLPADREKAFLGSTDYTVLKVVHDSSGALKPGGTVHLDRYRASKAGDMFLLLGTKMTELEWGSPLEVTDTSFNYITQAPSKEVPATERLAYFVKFLEFSDQIVADDAYGEFANAQYKDIVAVKDKFPREKLREWLANPQTVPSRLGLYGLMTGLSGTEADAEYLKGRLLEPVEGFRLGIDGMMGGYLLLVGEKGLEVLEDAKLRSKTVPFSETYATMQALRFMWTYGDERISKDRLRQSMRIILDRPELADLVIVDLGRWQDWSVADRLMELYGTAGYDIPSTKRAIVRFYLTMEAAKPKDAKEPFPEHVVAAQKHLKTLREKDPETVKAAEEFFFLNF